MSVDDDTLLGRTPTEPDAFAAFYRRHERSVVAYFMGRTGDPEIAADLTAETFAAALVAAARYRPGEAPAEAWLFGIARHKLLRFRERQSVETRARDRLGMERLVLDDERLEAIAAASGSEAAAELLGQLPDEQAEAIRGRVIEERGYADLAARLDTSEIVIRKRVSRGLERLRRRLGGMA